MTAAPAGEQQVRLSRKVPHPSPESRPFWDGCARHELLLQRCGPNGHLWFPPSSLCPRCWSADFTWTAAAGVGTIFSFTVYRRAYAPELAGQVPYVVGIVELAEGPRLITNIVDCDPADIAVGMPVEVVFEDLTDDVTLHAFRPRRDLH